MKVSQCLAGAALMNKNKTQNAAYIARIVNVQILIVVKDENVNVCNYHTANNHAKRL